MVKSCLIFETLHLSNSDGVISFSTRRKEKVRVRRLEAPLQGSTRRPLLTACRAIVFPARRSPSEAQEGAGVFGASVGPAGDPLVLEVQHLGGARPLRGAATLELRHPPQ